MRQIHFMSVLIGFSLVMLASTFACGAPNPENEAIAVAKDWAENEGDYAFDRTKKAQKQNVKDYKEEGYDAKGQDVKWEFSIYSDNNSETGSNGTTLRQTLLEGAEERVRELAEKYGESSDLNQSELYIVQAKIDCSVSVEYDRGRETIEPCKRATLSPLFGQREYATPRRGFSLMVDIVRMEVLSTGPLPN